VIGRVLLSMCAFLVALSQPGYSEETRIIETEEVIVMFEEPLGAVAEEVTHVYRKLKLELEESLGWRLNFRPTVFLIRNRERFERIAGSPYLVALAIPERMLVVIDYSKVNIRPFSLRTVLKHELCHLLLHSHIKEAHLPKWLDEGVSQWVSDGIAEIIMGEKQSVLDEAILSGNYISLDVLGERFPEDRRSLLLAYEESRSFVEFIASQFGRSAILGVLEQVKDGHPVELAVLRVLSIPLDELEGQWHGSLEKRATWLTYLTQNLYVILFFLAALITILGFIRVFLKKRRYQDEPDDDL